MAAGITKISDIIVPDVFTQDVIVKTAEKSNLIKSGALVVDEALSGLLAGAGLTFILPKYKDLDNDEENISTDDTADVLKDTPWNALTDARPKKIGMFQEVGVRLSRNQSWGTADLTKALGQSDPADAIASLVADYWVRRLQAAWVSAMKGVFADNAAAPAGTEHVQNDLTFNASTLNGGVFSDGVTNFTPGGFYDATITMGDSVHDLKLMQVHSVVYNTMRKNDVIDFVPDSDGKNEIPVYRGARLVVDDGMPNTAGVFESWIFGESASRLGQGSPAVPTEVARYANAGNGGGMEVLHNRVEWMIHPTGHAYVGTPANGGPSNAATANNLAHADSWQRRFKERKQIKMARFITREF